MAVSEEEALIPKPGQDTTSINVIGTAPKKKKYRKKKKKTISCWSMITNFKFLFFLSTAIISCGLFLWWYALYPNTQMPYVFSGVLGLLISTTGYRTFNQLIALTLHANVFEKNNAKFKGTHRAIKNDVSKMHNANKHLRNTELRLRDANKRNQRNLSNFRDVQNFMQEMDIKDFEEVSKKAQNMGTTWHDQLLRQERDMLHLIFDRYEMNHDQENEHGMTEKNFKEFALCLPDAYREKFARLGTFKKFSNNKNILEYADFEMVLDVFAEMVVDDVDIEIEIKKQNTAANLHGLPVLDEHKDIGSWETDPGSDEEEDTGGGFLNKLAIWRRGRKLEKVRSSAHIKRELVVKGTTPTTNSNHLGAFDMFDNAENAEKKEKKKEKKMDTLHTQPKVVKTASMIDAMHDIGDVSLNDDEINAYMAKQNK